MNTVATCAAVIVFSNDDDNNNNNNNNNNSGAPRVRKFGKLSIPENLVMT